MVLKTKSNEKKHYIILLKSHYITKTNENRKYKLIQNIN